MGVCLSLFRSPAKLPPQCPYVCSKSPALPTDVLDIQLQIDDNGQMTLYLKNIVQYTVEIPSNDQLIRYVSSRVLKDIEMGFDIPYKGEDEHLHIILPIGMQRLGPGAIRRVELGCIGDRWVFPPLNPAPIFRTLSILIRIVPNRCGLFESRDCPKVRRKFIFRIPSTLLNQTQTND
jgi:hypothetical protein